MRRVLLATAFLAIASSACIDAIKKRGAATPTPTPITINGGKLDNLVFGIVGDTRPASVNQSNTYPTLIINAIYDKLQNANPRPPFAISTGDYIFASDG